MNSYITEFDIRDPEPTRRLSRSLAAVVSALELDQPIVVTANDLAAIADAAGIHSPVNVLAARLRKEGWLLPTRVDGVWEFAPAAHAGPYGHGDPFLDLRVLAARYPDSNPAVAGTSAMWALGYLERHGEPIDIAVAPGTHIPAGLTNTLKATTFEPRVSTTLARGVTVLRPASIVVHAASHPSAIRWRDAAAGLAELLEAIDADQLEHELVTRPRAVRLRTAYLIHGVRPDLADTVTTHDPPRTWFGPRGVARRYASRFGIADTLLPFDPADLAEGEPTP